MTKEDQLARWLAGDPVHDDTCVPDFSCCNRALLADADTRKAFAAAHEACDVAAVMQLLGRFLSAAVAADGIPVRITMTRPDGES